MKPGMGPALLIAVIFLIIPIGFVIRGSMVFVNGERTAGLIMLGFGVAIIAAALWGLAYAVKNSTGETLDPEDRSVADRFARAVARWTDQSGSL